MDIPVKDIFNISSEKDFNESALKIFSYQAVNSAVYSQWLYELGVDHKKVKRITDIPFLPVSLYRNHTIISGKYKAEKIFISSGTTGMQRSRHYVASIDLYEKSFTGCFRNFYGEIDNYVILALLPSYFEGEGSSLVYMADGLISQTGSEHSGFFLDDHSDLMKRINMLQDDAKRIILLGVSFALLDLAEYSDINMSNHIVMETGGMKGRREEMTREELHSTLKESFNLENIHSEYGMTELLSQAYSKGGGIYKTPPWMKIFIRDPHDPFSLLGHDRTGGVNIIDLANIYSCSFIETSDLGISHPDGSFEITGRFDNSDIRGCNLLAV
ncbi:MAG TPA: acyl transferase [Bacteroidales bacterium]|nr:acyl transferase [Bacteroidales bacterium]